MQGIFVFPISQQNQTLLPIIDVCEAYILIFIQTLSKILATAILARSTELDTVLLLSETLAIAWLRKTGRSDRMNHGAYTVDSGTFERQCLGRQ